MRWRVAVLLAMGTIGGPVKPAVAAERTGVFVSTDDEIAAPVADNLSEVALAKVAEQIGGPLVSNRELGHLSRGGGLPMPANECLKDQSCTELVRARLELSGVVTGLVTREGRQYRLEFSWRREGMVQSHVLRASDSSTDSLILSVQEVVAELFAPAKEGRVNVQPPSAGLPAAATTPSGAAQTRAGRPSLLPAVAYGTAAASLLSVSAAAVFGTIGTADATGPTRQSAQEELNRLSKYDRTANVLFVVSGLLAGISVAAFLKM